MTVAITAPGVRICAWCPNVIPPTMRADAVCCSVRCRQARHRFGQGVGQGVGQASATPLRLAYADPPYPGLSRRYYSQHPDYAGEVDHPALIRSLSRFDGWALSTSAEALPEVLASCPPGVRVAAWVRGERPTRSARPLNAWEPVIYFGGRALMVEPSGQRRLDALVHVSRPRTTDARRVIGAKPAKFAGWLFALLGALPGDDFTDVFAGSGGIARAWRHYTSAGDDGDASRLQLVEESAYPSPVDELRAALA